MIVEIRANWFTASNGECTGDEYDVYRVGEKNVVKIHEHLPRGDTDPYYCLVDFSDGAQKRVMNLNSVLSDEDGM